jgi:membrane protease YdiL (CAAX protease family)
LLGRAVAFACAGVFLVAIPPLRRASRNLLLNPIPSTFRSELILVAIAKLPLMLGIVGATALWIWMTQGGASLAAQMHSDPVSEYDAAFSMRVIVFFFILGGIVGPVLEELVFRGFLYNAWEERWGWMPATIGVSTLFAIYHPSFLTAFASSVLFICVMRRTGSLWAPIAVHSAGNISLWYPLAGQLLVPSPEKAIGDISSWGLHLACLMVSLIAFPIYVWMAREKKLAATVFLER